MAKGPIQLHFARNTIVFVSSMAPKGGTALGHLLADGCNLAAAILSAGASYYWYRASTVKPPPEVLLGLMGWGTRAEPTKPNVSVDTRPLVQFVNDSSTANKTVAIWSVFAALAWAVSGIATFFN
jgi:hypothetical protein